MKRINYVVAAWSGSRRGDRESDGATYLRIHLDSLASFRHSLSQVTVIVTHNPSESEETASSINNLDGTRIQNTPVKLVRRENVGLSYGSYSYAYDLFRASFEYYIFIEDDYVFTMNDFDEIMVDLFNGKENCGFVCALVKPYRGRSHAAISNGITRSDILAKVWDRFGRLPHHTAPGYSSDGQVAFSRAFEDVGYRLHDFTDRFRSPFYDWSSGQVVEYAPERSDYLMKPAQMLTAVNKS